MSTLAARAESVPSEACPHGRVQCRRVSLQRVGQSSAECLTKPTKDEPD